MTTEKLTLAEAYYTVAADLERQADWYAETASNLNRLADALCEASMREKAQEAKP